MHPPLYLRILTFIGRACGESADKMDLHQVHPFIPLLHSLHTCKGLSEKNILMSHLDDRSFKFMCNMMSKCINQPDLLNLKSGKLTTLRKKLLLDRERIKYLTAKGKVTEAKRRAVRQSGEGVGALLGVLAPVLINLVKGLLTKEKK